MTTRRALRIMSAVVACLLAGAGAARAFEPSPYGINIHAPGDPELERQLDRVAAAGIGWVRIDFAWAVVQPARGTWDWRLYDRIADEAAARDLEVFATLAYTPAWATAGPPLTGAPSDPADWREFCRRAARRYRGKIDFWGLWNEANLPRFWSGSRKQYIDLIVAAGIDGVRAGSPDAKVGGPELAHLTSGDSDWYYWLRDTLLAQGDRLDFVTHHLYDDDGPGDVTKKLEDSTLFGRRPGFWGTVAPSVREVLESAGAEDKPFWLTETGWASDRVGAAQQASYTAGLLDRWLTGRPDRDWVAKIFFYELQDDPAAGVPKWGVLDAAGAPKPVYGAYRDFITIHPVALPPDARLPLLGGRFPVEVSWRDFAGHSGYGHALPASDESGFFWFFGSENLELVVKLLDGRTVNNHFWVFWASLTNVEYTITVTDTSTGATRRYHNPPGSTAGGTDTSAF
jgi:hypothetical protein